MAGCVGAAGSSTCEAGFSFITLTVGEGHALNDDLEVVWRGERRAISPHSGPIAHRPYTRPSPKSNEHLRAITQARTRTGAECGLRIRTGEATIRGSKPRQSCRVANPSFKVEKYEQACPVDPSMHAVAGV